MFNYNLFTKWFFTCTYLYRYIQLCQIVCLLSVNLLQQKNSSTFSCCSSPLEKLKPETNFFSKDYVTGGTFFLEVFGNARLLFIFAYF